MESYYDTASLLYVLKNRVLDEVGYNYSGTVSYTHLDVYKRQSI